MYKFSQVDIFNIIMGLKCEVMNCKTGHNSERKGLLPPNHFFTQSTLDLDLQECKLLLYADVLIRI